MRRPLAGIGLTAVGIAGLAATAVLLSAFGGVRLSATLPLDGQTQGKIARQPYVLAMADNDRAATFCAEDALSDMARRSVILEPLDGNALSSATLAHGCGDEGIELPLDAANRSVPLNRRTLTLQALQLQAQTQGGDTEAALATVQRMIVTQPQISDRLVPAIGAAFGQGDDIARVAGLMRGHPEWMRAMIRHAAANLDPNRAVAVRQAFRDQPLDQLAAADRDAVGLLAGRGALAPAWSVYQLTRAASSRSKDSLLAADGLMRPFGWTIPDNDQIRARLSSDEGLLIRANLRLAASGTLAFQAFPVRDGRFRLSVDADLPDNVSLEPGIRCIDGQEPGRWRAIEAGAEVDIAAALPGCSFAAFRLQIVNTARDRRSAIRIRSVDLTKI